LWVRHSAIALSLRSGSTPELTVSPQSRARKTPLEHFNSKPGAAPRTRKSHTVKSRENDLPLQSGQLLTLSSALLFGDHANHKAAACRDRPRNRSPGCFTSLWCRPRAPYSGRPHNWPRALAISQLDNAGIELADERSDARCSDDDPGIVRLAPDEFGRGRLVAVTKDGTQTNFPGWTGRLLAHAPSGMGDGLQNAKLSAPAAPWTVRR
jgi:hypothetical protein